MIILMGLNSAIVLEQPLTSSGYELDLSPECFGELERSDGLWNDGDAAGLRERMKQDGYLYLPDILNTENVLEVRRLVTDRLAAEGLLNPAYPSMDAICIDNVDVKFRPDLTENNPALHRLLYEGELVKFFTEFLGEPVRHFDFTWFRAISPGKGTQPHCDIVYMGRGTQKLFTSWVPMGEVPLSLGGLMILEKSHLQSGKISNYLSRDVDEFCLNQTSGEGSSQEKKERTWGGELSKNPVKLREKLGGRWLTSSQFNPGDVLIFTMHTVHASLDNQTQAFRFSSDSRYQAASEPADERWIGVNPIGHSLAGKRGRIC